MSGDDSGAEKPHKPSPRKLADARRRGEIARSADLVTVGAYAGLLLMALALGGWSLEKLARGLVPFIERPDLLNARLGLEGGGAAGAPMGGVVLAILPWMAAPFVGALLLAAGQGALIFPTEKLAPKLNRISIVANAGNKFGRGGLFEFAKSTVKLVIYSTVLFIFLRDRMPGILALMAASPAGATGHLLRLAVEFLLFVATVALVIGAVDYLWQRTEHLRKNRMTRKELTDEQKDSEGDPMMKQQRRQRAMEYATNTMLSDVPEASVVGVNPTHFAVALKWSQGARGAPVVVAKGVDHVAARIREVATEAGVPIHSDPPTARAIHAIVDVGEEIRPVHYAAVAVAIRFAEAIRAARRGAAS